VSPNPFKAFSDFPSAEVNALPLDGPGPTGFGKISLAENQYEELSEVAAKPLSRLFPRPAGYQEGHDHDPPLQ